MNNLALAEKLETLYKQATEHNFQALGTIQTNPYGLMMNALSRPESNLISNYFYMGYCF